MRKKETDKAYISRRQIRAVRYVEGNYGTPFLDENGEPYTDACDKKYCNRYDCDNEHCIRKADFERAKQFITDSPYTSKPLKRTCDYTNNSINSLYGGSRKTAIGKMSAKKKKTVRMKRHYARKTGDISGYEKYYFEREGSEKMSDALIRIFEKNELIELRDEVDKVVHTRRQNTIRIDEFSRKAQGIRYSAREWIGHSLNAKSDYCELLGWLNEAVGKL